MFTPPGVRVRLASYDLPAVAEALLRSSTKRAGLLDPVVWVQLDAAPGRRSLVDELGARRRDLARVLDHLAGSGARAVILDVNLHDAAARPEIDLELERAIRANGRVVLAAYFEPVQLVRTLIAPLQPLGDAAHAIGSSALLEPTADGVVRMVNHDVRTRHFVNDPRVTCSLTWEAARLAGLGSATSPAPPTVDQWVRFYGPPDTLLRLGLDACLTRPINHFTNKLVVIGFRPEVGFGWEQVDRHRTPFSAWTGSDDMTGAELQATVLLNLVHAHGIRQVAPLLDAGAWLLGGLLLPPLLAASRPRPPVLALRAMAIGIALATAGFGTLALADFWFSWSVIAVLQLPGVVLWVICRHPAPGLRQPAPGLHIPDHELLRPVGAGASGEVWLARDVVGRFLAVKIVRRADQSAVLFHREFHGLKHYAPLSFENDNLVKILHCGMDPDNNWFYYVMEAADDPTDGQAITPVRYAPASLRQKLSQPPGRLSPERCVALGLRIASALEFLHARGLLHRDVKPGNIIYIRGEPRLADIGLVVAVNSDASVAGTPAYMAHDRPLCAKSDVYTLGLVLLEAAGVRNPRDAATPRIEVDLQDQDALRRYQDLLRLLGSATEECLEDRLDATQLREGLEKLARRWERGRRASTSPARPPAPPR
jgi:hypothetical protein